MKLYIFPLLIGSVSAFSPAMAGFGLQRASTTLMSRVDSTDAIKEALAASKEFGPTSKEARIAWEVVEEMDSSDNSEATKGAAVVETNEEYNAKVKALSELLNDQKSKMDEVKALAEQLQGIKISAPNAGAVSPDSAEMRAALSDASAATEDHGIDSPEARLAWETVEEIASSDVSEATKGSLEEECLVEAIEACEAIEALQNALAK